MKQKQIKTIKAIDAMQFDKLVNRFMASIHLNDIFDIKTHIAAGNYVCVILYIAEEEKKEVGKLNEIENTPFCEKCNVKVDQAVKSFSLQHYSKILCRECQKGERR